MKAEINNENKAGFFGLHLGQMVEYPNMDGKPIRHKLVAVGFEYLHVNYKRRVKGCIGEELAFSDNGNHKSNALNAKLNLKPLSSITDEDAREVGLSPTSFSTYSDYLPPLSPKDFDYLRSRGYSLPFLGLSVKELISAGWVKLVEP